MKFVKENLTLVIIGAVVLLSIVSVFYPFGSWKDTLGNEMGEHFNTVKSSLDKMTKTNLEIPSLMGPDGKVASRTFVGWPTKLMKDYKDLANSQIKAQANTMFADGARLNRRGRITERDDIPQIGNVIPVKGFLPKMGPGARPLQFRDNYRSIFDIWNNTLVGTPNTPPLPPALEELKAQFKEIQEKDVRGRPAGLNGGQVVIDPREEADYIRRAVLSRAATIRMYIEPEAFQARDWRDHGSPPNETQMFEALVDSWLQADVVAAIAKINGDSKNVGTSPVKRLIKITVGNEALSQRIQVGERSAAAMAGSIPAPGAAGNSPMQGLFVLPPPTTQAAGENTTPGANIIEYGRTMTGRSSGNDYDVVPMQIWMDIDPSAINKFEEALYMTNMGYTVLNERSKVVNPLDRMGNGYIYGPTQVWEVEITVEALLFRNWTINIMPEEIKKTLGIKETK